MTRAIIYRPSKTAMQSGWARTKRWVLKFRPEEKQANDPLMGWAGSGDMRQQIRLEFDTLEEAKDYATRKGLDYVVRQDEPRRFRPRSYADNFK